MDSKSFIDSDGYQEGDTVIYGEKAFRDITKIQRGVAHMIHRDGTGEPTEKKVKMTELPPLEIDVAVDDADDDGVQVVDYAAGQKLANGWEIDKPSVKGKYFVYVNGSKLEMAEGAITAAVRDYEARLAARKEEARIHAEAEQAALAESDAYYEAKAGKDEGREKDVSPRPDDEDKTEDTDEQETIDRVLFAEADDDGKENWMTGVLAKLDEVVKQTEKVLTIEDRITDKLAELADRYDERIRAIEKRLQVSPALPHRPKVVVKTVRVSHDDKGSETVADHLNRGWRIMTHTDRVTDAIFRLVRDVDRDEDTPPDESKVMNLPGRTRLVETDTMVIDDVTEKYAHLTPMTRKMAAEWDGMIDENTRSIMGEMWYEQYGA